MKIITLIILLLSTPAFAVDIHLLVKETDIEKWGIKLTAKRWEHLPCSTYNISFPQTNKNSELAQPFSFSQFILWDGPPDPYEIAKSSFRIPLATIQQGEEVYIWDICISDKDKNSAYISISYTFGKKHPPTVIFIKMNSANEIQS